MLKKSPSDWLSLGHGGSNPLDPHYLISPLAPLHDDLMISPSSKSVPPVIPAKKKKWMNIGLWYNRWKVKCLAKKGRRVFPSTQSPHEYQLQSCSLVWERKERKRGRIKSEFNYLSFVFEFFLTLLHNPNEERCNEEEDDERIFGCSVLKSPGGPLRDEGPPSPPPSSTEPTHRRS